MNDVLNKRCNHCGGTLYIDFDTDYGEHMMKCYNCARSFELSEAQKEICKNILKVG